MSDCIRVMQYRLMISVLENLDHCADALVGCKVCIDDLHSMPAVKTSFDVYLEKGISSHFSEEERNEIISTVCHVHGFIYDVTVAAGQGISLSICSAHVAELGKRRDNYWQTKG